jgi:hypothetical protein
VADLKQQDDDADLGQQVQRVVAGIGVILWVDQPEHRRADQHTGDQLAQHRGLTDALRQGPDQLGDAEQQHQQAEKLRNVERLHGVTLSRAQGGYQADAIAPIAPPPSTSHAELTR